MTAKLLAISEREYHADPCGEPSLSSSTAKTIITRSPYHAWREHPRLGGIRREPSKAMDLGSLIHSLVLDGGKGIVTIGADDYRTKAAQEARDAARAAGGIPVLRRELEPAAEAAVGTAEKLAIKGVRLDGKSGAVITWQEPSGYGPVQCRAMLDHLWPTGFLELKTISSADPATCERQSLNLGYDIQIAAYSAAVEALFPQTVGRVDVFLAFVESSQPHSVTAFRPAESFLDFGRRRWRRAVETWARCLHTGEWPEYQPPAEIGMLSVPAWAGMRELEHEEA